VTSLPLTDRLRWVVRFLVFVLAPPALLCVLLPPAFGAEEPLSLDETVKLALQNSPRVSAAQARLEQSASRVGAAKAQRGFHLNFVSTNTRQGPEVSFAVSPFSSDSISVVPTFRFQHALELRRNVYDGGRLAAQQRIAQIGADISRRTLEQTRDDVVLDAKIAYFEVLRARRLRDVGQETLKAVEQHLRITQSRFNAGVAAKFDVLRSEAEVEDARQILIDDETAVELADAQFNTVLRRPLTTPVQITSVEDAPSVDINLAQALEAARQHRPELLTLPQHVAIAQQDIRAARSGWKPNLDFFSNYNRVTASAFQKSYSYALTAVVSFPVFDSGLARSQVAEAKQGLKETEQTNENVRQRIELQIKQAYLSLVRARQRRVTAEKEVAAAQESLRVAQVRYNAGVGTNVEVTDARVAWTRAQWNQVNALYDYHIALAQLEHGMGAGVDGVKTAKTQ
jgi:outer membrane protein TolC